MNKPDNILRVRLDANHWQQLYELCQTHDRSLPDMVRKLIRDERARMGKENTMSISKNQNQIVVSGYGKQYAVDENEEAFLGNGNGAEMTVGEAHAAGLLRVVDDPEGKTHGMHGALYVQ